MEILNYHWGMDVNKGDTVYVKNVYDVATSLKEFLGFMRFSLEVGFDVVIEEKRSIDTRTAVGQVLREFLLGLDKFDDKMFQHDEDDDDR